MRCINRRISGRGFGEYHHLVYPLCPADISPFQGEKNLYIKKEMRFHDEPHFFFKYITPFRGQGGVKCKTQLLSTALNHLSGISFLLAVT